MQMQGNPVLNQIKGMFNFMKMAKNPNQALMDMANKNPRMQQVVNMCQGKNPKDVFYSKCSEMGVNPEDILNMMK